MKNVNKIVSLGLALVALYSCEVDPISEDFDIENQLVEIEVEQQYDNEDLPSPDAVKISSINSSLQTFNYDTQRTEDEDDVPPPPPVDN